MAAVNVEAVSERVTEFNAGRPCHDKASLIIDDLSVQPTPGLQTSTLLNLSGAATSWNCLVQM